MLKISHKTAEITMPSGIKAVIKQLMGKHQKMLTQSRVDINDRFNNVLVDIIIEIDGIDWESMKPLARKAFVRKMLTIDRKYILTEARQLSKSYDPTFDFKHEWKNSKGVKCNETFKIHLLDEDNQKDIIDSIKAEYNKELHSVIDKLNRIGCFPTKPYRQQFKTYKEIVNNSDVEFSGEGQLAPFDFTFRLLNGVLEEKIDHKTASSHTKILCRLPRWRNKKIKAKDGEKTVDTWKKLTEQELDEMPPECVDFIRNKMTYYEGAIDTIETIDNPDSSSDRESITVDLTAEITFFFPSGQV